MSAFRLAGLVIAHANPATFGKLARALDHPDIALFCHIDARSDLDAFRREAPRVTFLRDRIENHWGAYTQVEVALRLLRTAMHAGPFGAYATLSGDCLPLVTNDVLLQAFGACPTIMRMNEQLPGDKSYARVRNSYVPAAQLGRLKGLSSHLDRFVTRDDLLQVQRALRARRAKQSIPFRVFKGPQWLSLSHGHAERILAYLGDAASEQFRTVFEYAAIPDELFFQTALHIVDPDCRAQPGFMGADWRRTPKPFVIRSDADLDLILDSRLMFFRKFTDAAPGIVDAVLAARLDRAMLPVRRNLALRYIGLAGGTGDRAAIEDDLAAFHDDRGPE